MDNKALIRRFYETVVSRHLLDALPRYIGENCVQIDGTRSVPLGVPGMRRHLEAVRATYPDLTVTVLRQYAEGDAVISEVVLRGTHLGTFCGIPPTGETVEITGVNIDHVAEGKIVSHGGAANTFEALWARHMIGPAPDSA